MKDNKFIWNSLKILHQAHNLLVLTGIVNLPEDSTRLELTLSIIQRLMTLFLGFRKCSKIHLYNSQA